MPPKPKPQPSPKPNIDPPIRFVNSLGLATFVALDYTLPTSARFEHSVTLISGNWDSLYDLIKDPYLFVEQWRLRYLSTPQHGHGLKGTGALHPDWVLAGPVNIILEPITNPSTANISVIHGLIPLYPKLANVNMHTSPTELLSQLVSATTVKPKSNWPRSAKSKWEFSANLENEYARLQKDVPADKRKPFREFCKDIIDAQAPPTGPAFNLAYVAEFALQTRTITIRYVPQPNRVQDWFDTNLQLQASAQKVDQLTGVTANMIGNLQYASLHFDIAFGNTFTLEEMADRRARFVMDWLVDPAYLFSLKRPGDHKAVQPLRTDNLQYSLPDPSGFSYRLGPVLSINDPNNPSQGMYPTVFIDSIHPLTPTTSNNSISKMATAGDPLCAVVGGIPVYDQQQQFLGWMVGGILVKAYE